MGTAQPALHIQSLKKEERRKDRLVDFFPQTEFSSTEPALKTGTMTASNVLLSSQVLCTFVSPQPWAANISVMSTEQEM